MKATIKDRLTEKGLKIPEEHLEILVEKWAITQDLRGNLSGIKTADGDIGIINVAQKTLLNN